MAFRARHPGRCVACGSRIRPDDMIRMTEDGAVHDECLYPESWTFRILDANTGEVVDKITVCGRCNLTKPCECEDD